MIVLSLLLTAGGARSATTISLAQGWNLISLPLQQPVNTPVATVLSGVSGFYEVVWAYSNGAWKVYDPNDTAGSTLKTMQAGNGYWIKMLSAKKLSVSGTSPSPSTIPLVSGWNLVGYNGPPNCTDISNASTGVAALGNLQVLWGYPSQGWQSYPSGGLTQLCQGAGYWLDVNGTANWGFGSVSGTAASGSPIASATVTLVDKNGNTAGGTTGSDGSFAFSGTGAFTPPFMLQVQTGSGNLYSVGADPNASTTINVTPLTDMIIRSWYSVQGTTVDTAFASPATYSPPTPIDVKVISSVVLTIVEGWLQAAGVDTNDFNLISTPFAANGTGVDGVLDLTGVDPTTGIVTITGSNATQTSTVTPSSTNGSVSVSTTQTTSGGTTSPVTTSTVVPTTPTQATALAGINTTITNFMNTVNLKGASLTGSDLAPYVDPNYLYNGEGPSQWEAGVAHQLAGSSLTYTGLQINSLDTSTNIADVTFQITQTQGGVASSQPVETNFKLINGVWLITGNGQLADAYVQTWGWYQPTSPGVYNYSMTLTLAVGDPRQNNVESVTVSGPGISGSLAVPMICSYHAGDGCQDNNGNPVSCPICGNSHGNGNEQRVFELDLNGYWPPLNSTYTFNLTTSSGVKTYTSSVLGEFGFDTSQNPAVPIPGDYPSMTITGGFTGGILTLSQILAGVNLTGTVYVPVWVQDIQDPPHFNYEGPNGVSNNVSNMDIQGSWNSGGFAIPGQVNAFTINIPAATILNRSAPCPSPESGSCPNIGFQGQTGQIQGGWFGYDAGYGNAGDSSAGGAFTNSGIEVTQ
jgi:hypothetical protein